MQSFCLPALFLKTLLMEFQEILGKKGLLGVVDADLHTVGSVFKGFSKLQKISEQYGQHFIQLVSEYANCGHYKMTFGARRHLF